jgi:lysozyme
MQRGTMRPARNLLTFLVVIGAGSIAGCTSSRTDALDVSKPSREITASISGPTPRGELGSREELDQILADPDTLAFSGPVEAPAAVEADKGETVLAMVPVPEPPAIKPKARPDFGGITIYRARFRDAEPIDFGRASPKPFAVHGVDVSRWQGDIDWAKLRTQGANFAYIKATDGGDHLDPEFRKNWNAAAAAGVPRGAYHFFFWCRDAETQARWFIRNVPKVRGALPPVIDVEWNHQSKACRKHPSRERVLAKMKVFMEIVERHYGQRPIIYTAPDFYEDNLQGQFKDYPFWLRSVAAHPSKVYPGRDWTLWQYSGTGLSKGVDHQIDLNVFNGSGEGWQRWLAKHTS